MLQEGAVDAVFTDIRMPGLSGLDLARVLSRFRTPPPVVFITAHDDHAVDAFELNAVDYVLKPVREDRLAEAVRRVVDACGGAGEAADEDSIPVELGGVTRFVARCDVLYVEAHGDYARLHTADDTHLIRTPLTTLEARLARRRLRADPPLAAGVLAHVDEVRVDAGRCSVVVGGDELAVSRRHTRELRDVLVRRARPGGVGPDVTEHAAPATGPGDQPAHRRRPAAAGRGHLGDRRADPARRDLHDLAAARAAAAGRRWCSSPSRVLVGGLPRPVHAAARPVHARRPGDAAVVGAARLRRLPLPAPAGLALRPRGRAQRAGLRRRGRAASERRTSASSRCCWSRSPRSRSAPTAGASPAPPATSSSPRGRCARRSTRPRSAGSTSPRRRSSASPGWCSPSAPTCCGTRSAGPPATSCCWCWSRRRCAAPGAYTLPDFAEARLESRSVRGISSVLVVAVGWLYLMPQFQGAGLSLGTVAGTPAVGRRPPGRLRRPGQRVLRRDAQHHLRAGLPVLAQAHRPPACPAMFLLARLGTATARRLPAAASITAGGVAGDVWASPLTRRAPTRSTRRTPSSWRPSSARWACRTSSCGSTPTPTAAPPGEPRSWCWPARPVLRPAARVRRPGPALRPRPDRRRSDRHRRARAAGPDGRRARRASCSPRSPPPGRSRRSCPRPRG